MRYIAVFGLLVLTLIVGLAVPLLGWGLDDVAGFFSHPARLAYVASMAVVLGLLGYRAFTLPRDYNPISRGRADRLVSRQSVMPLVNRAIVFAAFFLCPYSDGHDFLVIPGGDWLRYLGLVLFVGGLGLTYWAHACLGRQHSVEATIQEGHRLVTSGPYALIRHPIYLGQSAFPVGLALVFRAWPGLALALPIVGLFVWRISDEEDLLHREFGQEWESYSRRSWRLIPLVY
jgi:protein-S-isoprenylcysteine O-methyltransferase Ste14